MRKDTIFAKIADILKKNAGISKIKRALALKLIFSKMTYVCVLTDQFHVSNIILTSLRQGGYTLPQNEPLKSPPRLGLNACAKYEIFPDKYIRFIWIKFVKCMKCFNIRGTCCYDMNVTFSSFPKDGLWNFTILNCRKFPVFCIFKRDGQVFGKNIMKFCQNFAYMTNSLVFHYI